MLTSEKDRLEFKEKMLGILLMNNYGFAATDQMRPTNAKVITYDTVESLPALKELKVRLNIFVKTGRNDSGKIKYPEANRIIEYVFNGDSLGKCHINLKALSKETPYIFR